MQLIALPLALVLSSATDVPSPPMSADDLRAVTRELQPGDFSGQPRFERGPASPDMG
jgi:hypothetical protein